MLYDYNHKQFNNYNLTKRKTEFRKGILILVNHMERAVSIPVKSSLVLLG